jgi:ketosteroid isomerase-like protein
MTHPIQTPVTGREDPIDPRESVGALAEFYRAFNNRDLALMARNWDSSEAVSMDNPLGGIRRGWPEILPVYERIFAGEAGVKVAFHDYTIHRFGEMFFAVGRERGTFQSEGRATDVQFRTSRLFRLVEGRWRQVHHHGSIEDPDLLARYQQALR